MLDANKLINECFVDIKKYYIKKRTENGESTLEIYIENDELAKFKILNYIVRCDSSEKIIFFDYDEYKLKYQ